MMHTVLIIDDEPGIRTVLTDILEDEDYHVLSAADGLEGLDILKSETVDLVILDVWLPHKGGIDVLKDIKNAFPDLEVIVISGHANIDMAVKAVKNGAFDFLEKPLSLDKVITLAHNAIKLRSLTQENKQLRSSLFQEDEMIGESPALQEIWDRIKQSAATDAKVLITGENGTGKELVAREIHRRSKRVSRPFVEVNCAAIPDTLLESELFGHEKGAFTSAVGRRKGKFEIADGGTLFLDEIADMSLSAQAKVLRAIQEQKFERIGGEQSIQVDIRLITATNKNINDEIAAGRFREDLFFRLNVVPIHVPPLRQRNEDLHLLIDYFMEKFGRHSEQLPRSFTSDALRILKKYTWPGNIRELKNFIERINIMTDEQRITADMVEHFLGEKKISKTPSDLQQYSGMKLNQARAAFERRLIEQRLEECDYNISQTAQALGVYPSNLHSKIKKYGILNKK